MLRLPGQLKFGEENTQLIAYMDYDFNDENEPVNSISDKLFGSRFFVQTCDQKKNNFPDIENLVEQQSQYVELYKLKDQAQDEDENYIEEDIVEEIIRNSYFGKTYLIERFIY